MRFDKDTLARWNKQAADYLTAHHGHMTPDHILHGRDAWTVAHRAGITAEAYKDREVVDAHIQTALERIFPNAVFKDKKVY